MTSNFSFTNVTSSEVNVNPVDIKPVTNYAKVLDEPTEASFKNKTASLGKGEQLTYMCQPVKAVSTKQPILNPGKISSGVQYIVRLDEILSTVDENGLPVEDDPIVMYLTTRHTSSSYITPAHIEQVFKRLLGAMTREDGTFRFDELMISALTPNNN